MANFLELVIVTNDLWGGEYVEPYAGGASVALALLFDGFVSRIHINDFDPAVGAFWKAVVEDSEWLCRAIRQVPLTVDEWLRQRDIYRNEGDSRALALATFYLNRTNRSGIIKGGGIIGGLNQTGQWKMDARFNRAELIRRIERIAEQAASISVTCMDAVDFLGSREWPSPTLVYLDPPYYVKGGDLYANFYQPSDHAHVAKAVEALPTSWVVSYDNVEEIRRLYEHQTSLSYDLRYSARERYQGKEIMFFSPNLAVPVVADLAGGVKMPPDVSASDVKAAVAIPPHHDFESVAQAFKSTANQSLTPMPKI